MASYHTIQKRLLIDFMTENCDSSFTVEELAERIRKKYPDCAPGKSTLYRLITKLTEDGSVKRMTQGGGRSAVYQIAAGGHCDSHLHMKCTKCGRLLHMDDFESARLLMQIMQQSGFTVDEGKTVLYGHCSDCKPQCNFKRS